MLPIDDLSCDVLILGAGGAGMLAALHVTTANLRASIVIAVKGLLGQSSLLWHVQPVLDLQSVDAREFAGVARNESEAVDAADGGDLQIVGADG